MDTIKAAFTDAWRMIVPSPEDQRAALTPLVLVLTLVSGMLDAFAFLVVRGVFVGNMTGNVLFIGLGAVDAEGFSVSRALTALGAFVVGSFVGGRLDFRLGGHLGRLTAVTIWVEAALVAAAIGIIAVRGSESAAHLVAAALAIAMGMQTALARKLAISNLRTTVLTGTITAVFAEGPREGGTRTKFVRGVVAVVSLALGAAIGALLVEVDSYAALGAAAAILAVVAVISTLRFRDRRHLGGYAGIDE